MVKRRRLLAATGALGSSLAARPSATPRPVRLECSREQLDIAYDQSFWAPQIKEPEANDGTASAAVRQEMPPWTQQYGADA